MLSSPGPVRVDSRSVPEPRLEDHGCTTADPALSPDTPNSIHCIYPTDRALLKNRFTKFEVLRARLQADKITQVSYGYALPSMTSRVCPLGPTG